MSKIQIKSGSYGNILTNVIPSKVVSWSLETWGQEDFDGYLSSPKLQSYKFMINTGYETLVEYKRKGHIDDNFADYDLARVTKSVDILKSLK